MSDEANRRHHGAGPLVPPDGDGLAASETSAQPHPGWSTQPQSQYDTADSGGWGGPDHGAATGPLPRLRRNLGNDADTTPPRPDTTDRTDAAAAHPAPEQRPSDGGATAAHPTSDTADGQPRHDDGSTPDSAAGTTAWGSPADNRPLTGLATMADISFASRATRSLAPITYVLVVVYLFLDLVRSIYDYSSNAANFGPGALAGVLILIAVGLFRVGALTFVTRFAIEACLHLAELAEDRTRRS